MFIQINVETVIKLFPEAMAEWCLTPEEIERTTDIQFFLVENPTIHGGADLFCQSFDERNAFSFVNGEWLEIAFPLAR